MILGSLFELSRSNWLQSYKKNICFENLFTLFFAFYQYNTQIIKTQIDLCQINASGSSSSMLLAMMASVLESIRMRMPDLYRFCVSDIT